MPLGITAGPDGALWFAESGADQIGRITLDGTISEFALPAGSRPERITAGPDGAIWFTEPGRNLIGRLVPTVVPTFTEYAIPTPNSNPQGITAGPDGAVWFIESAVDQVGRVTPDGTFTEYALPWGRITPSGLQRIVTGPDGALWFTEQAAHAIGRVTMAGSFSEYPLPSGGDPLAITAGPDGALWFTEQFATQVGRITPDGQITEFGVHTLNTFYGDITAGADGALWFAVNNTIGSVQLGRITPDGQETFRDVPAPFGLGGLTTGPDGNIWVTETGGNAIGRAQILSPSPPEEVSLVTAEPPAPSSGGEASSSGSTHLSAAGLAQGADSEALSDVPLPPSNGQEFQPAPLDSEALSSIDAWFAADGIAGNG